LDNIRTTLNGKSNNSDIFSTIISIKNIGREHTYCLNIDKEHEMAVGGIYTAQCGEQPLLGHESCNLGSLNLGRFIKAKQMDWDRLQYVTKLAVRFLDNVIDMNKYPLPQVETKTKITRKIGLGVMGFADMLIKLGIKYDTDEAIQKAHEVMKFIHDNALVASTELATLRGVFPAYRGSTWCTEHGIRLRNACLTTIAPTGTLSIIANCSSGIEPYYSKTIKKHVLETILEEEIEFAKEDSFITSHEISPEWHVKIQAAFQAHSDSAVSKTINFPENATLEDVKHAYMLAFKLKCKGLTIYRDHSRKKQVLTSESETSFNPMSYAAELCPQCQAPIITEEGCKICSAKCGWSACSTG
jgi:ribonucleoside-diphosphate reductase alpha chain